MTNLEIMPTEEKSDPKFVNFLLLTIFGIETLARATITGNAKSNLSTNTLDDDKLLFIKGIISEVRFWFFLDYIVRSFYRAFYSAGETGCHYKRRGI
jgi:hypothetical protein